MPVGIAPVGWQDRHIKPAIPQRLCIVLVLAHGFGVVRLAQMPGGGDALGEVWRGRSQQGAREMAAADGS